MMAQQLWWEKSQGNLELYFAAPMHIMPSSFGMAFGGFVMSSTRAAAVLIIATTLYGRDVLDRPMGAPDRRLPADARRAVRARMMLAGLFLMWGREAWHLTQLLIEPVYFVSGLNFPIARLGVLGSVAISILPLAVGLDAMRQLAFAGTRTRWGTPSAGGRGADPRRDGGRLPRPQPLDAGHPGAPRPSRRASLGSLAMTTDGLAAPEWAASTRPAPAAAAGPTSGAAS